MTRPPHDIARAVRDELSFPGRYHLGATQVAHKTWLQVAFQWLWDRYSEFERALAQRIHLGRTGESVLGDLFVLGGIAIFAYVAARLLMSLQTEHMRQAETYELGSSRSAHLLARAAADAAAAGDYARAIRLLFAGAVTLLDLRGVVRDDASATVNDLRRALHERNAAADGPFLAIARAYTAAAYAEERIDESIWSGANAAYATLANAVKETA